MCAIKLEGNDGVIEIYRCPDQRRVARRTLLLPISGATKLPGVWIPIDMACRALSGCFGENRNTWMPGSFSLPGCLVTLDAAFGICRVQVRAFQLESGVRVVEGERNIRLLRGMTGFAGQVCLGIDFMRIGMTRIAGKGSKAISSLSSSGG